ncbi:hypothetical protein ATN89_21805 [Comamonas thiooxydans]|uniref:hypothetical protein n=1 Tax=Comamonas thiooxydans TaxID=363952 RepID=UPI0007C56BC2|nr:hypothetical protein [Comamonas thiooxydans]OAD82127.1 hypothetical protein ATN89_21805 [Comamonas thiooxydans]
MPLYTLEDHIAAKASLDSLNAKWDNYSGNNPNKFRADIEAAKARLYSIETALKANGLLARTPKEERNASLDAAFPNAQSREVVEWNGKRYMRRFTPVSKSLSGKTVNAWNKHWEEL